MRGLRRARSRARVLRAGLLIRLLALAAALLVAPSATASARAEHHPSLLDVDAAARAEGNRPEEARRLGRALLARTWPAQVLKVRVDGAGAHEVAGLMLSGVKFHGRLDESGFLAEVAALVSRAFAASRVEEVDVWTAVPIAVGKGAIVSGDFAEPASRIVFSATLRRADSSRLAEQLRGGRNVFWDPAWRASLHDRGTR